MEPPTTMVEESRIGAALSKAMSDLPDGYSLIIVITKGDIDFELLDTLGDGIGWGHEFPHTAQPSNAIDKLVQRAVDRFEAGADDVKRCLGCSCAVHPSCDYCGECLCEEDGY